MDKKPPAPLGLRSLLSNLGHLNTNIIERSSGFTIFPSTEQIQASLSKNRRVILNVGGDRHEILWETLARYPATRLGQLSGCLTHERILEVADDYTLAAAAAAAIADPGADAGAAAAAAGTLETKNEYFWDRQPRSFPLILNLYRRNKLHLAEDLCVMEFGEDLEYWGVSQLHLDSCCQMKFQQRRDQLSEDMRKDEEVLEGYQEEEDWGVGALAKSRRFIWELFEKSDTWPQKIVGLVSIIIILTSIVTLSISTLPSLTEYRCRHPTNQSLCSDPSVSLPSEFWEEVDHPVLDLIEICCVAWFTFEYLIRLLSSPDKVSFFRDWLNNIDLLAILPFYAGLFLGQLDVDTPVTFAQMLRVIRILRIFKLARHSTGLQSLGFTLRHSYKNLGVLLLFLSIGVVIFSTLAYFAERDDNPGAGFDSIPETFYWALVTMSTVGYGDVSPKTVGGKCVAMLTAITGVIMIALPIPIIVDNFGLFYEEQRRKEKALKRRKALQDLENRKDSGGKGKKSARFSIRGSLGAENKGKEGIPALATSP